MQKGEINMQKSCSILGAIVLVLGIIGSIALAWNNGVTVTYDSYFGIEEKRSVLLTIIWFVCGIFTTAVGTVILVALGEILEYQESISKRISEIEGKLSSVERKDKESDDITYKGSWKCPQCGRVNASYTGTCGCGQIKV